MFSVFHSMRLSAVSQAITRIPSSVVVSTHTHTYIDTQRSRKKLKIMPCFNISRFKVKLRIRFPTLNYAGSIDNNLLLKCCFISFHFERDGKTLKSKLKMIAFKTIHHSTFVFAFTIHMCM